MANTQDEKEPHKLKSKKKKKKAEEINLHK